MGLKIGNAQAFWGDCPGAAATLVAQVPDLDYLTLDYLAELSLSIMAIQKEKDPSAGYARDFLEVIRSLIPLWKQGAHVKIVTNAGGLNPRVCAENCRKILKEAGSPLRVGVVLGDDLFAILNPDSPLSCNLETGEPLSTIQSRLVTANAYLGAKPLVEALQAGADIVIAGRVADPSLTVAPCVAHFGWSWEDYDCLAGATIAGHLIECGTQVTGGISTEWLEIPDVTNIGFPIAEVDDKGNCIITKPRGSGGKVSVEIVKEQLLYEIGDPNQYLSPDVTVSFLDLKVQQIAVDCVEVAGAKGKAPTSTYKVSATYRDGFKTEAMLTLFGEEVAKKAKRAGEILLQRVKDAGYALERSSIECIGAGAVVPGVISQKDVLECVLRVAVADSRFEALDYFSKEVASLVTAGPQGVTGYSSGRPHIRPVFGYWPCLVEKEKVKTLVELL